MAAGADRSSGEDQITGPQGGKSGNIIDQPGKAPGEVIGGIVLTQFAIDSGL